MSSDHASGDQPDSQPAVHPLPARRIVGFDISQDNVMMGKAVDNESPTSILELGVSPSAVTGASMAPSESKGSLVSSSSSTVLSRWQVEGDRSPPKSYLAEELKRHSSRDLDETVLDDHVKRGLPRLKIQRS
jgi:hypothetical protein